MARFEMAGLESAVLGQAPATADSFYQLGIKYSVGADVDADLVSAHKWFNLAAMKGNKDAIQLRQFLEPSDSRLWRILGLKSPPHSAPRAPG